MVSSIETPRPIAVAGCIQRRRQACLMAAAVAIAVLPFWHVWLDMLTVAFRDDTFGYALAVPPVAAYIAWRRIGGGVTKSRHVVAGLAIVAAGMLLHLVALRHPGAHLAYAWYGSALVVLFGTVVAGVGHAAARSLLSVFALLVLVVPVPPGVVSKVGHQLMYLSATITADLLRLMGIATRQYLNLLVVDGFPVNVSDTCSGLRSFFALLGSVALFCVAGRLRWPIAALLLLITPGLAILGNIARLLPTALFYRFGTDTLGGVAHNLLGFLAVGLAAGLIVLLLYGLRWAGIPLQAPRARATPGLDAPAADLRTPWMGILLCGAVIGVVGGAGSVFEWPSSERDAYHRRIAGVISGTDLTLPEWRVEASELDEWATELLRPNASRRVRLEHPGLGQTVHLSFIHCRYQRDLVYHTPPSCYPSAGWILQQSRALRLPLAGGSVPAREYLFLRVGEAGLTRIAVVNLLALPDGRMAADEVEAFSGSVQQGRHDGWGAGQLTLVFGSDVPREDREALAQRLVEVCRPMLEAIVTAPIRDVLEPQPLAFREGAGVLHGE